MKKILRVLVVAALLLAIAIPCLATAEEHTHVWVGNGRKEATCTENGAIYYKCSVAGCTATYETVVEALGHDFEGGVVDTITKSTCETAGTGKAHCKRCSATKNVTLELAPHTPATTSEDSNWGVPATCGTDGWKCVKYCSVCKTVLEKKTVPATGEHHLVRQTIKTSTCTVKGYTALKCDNPGCKYVDESQKEELPLAEHTPSATATRLVSEATCTAPAKYAKYCTVCGETLQPENVGEKLGHDWSASVVDKQPTCDEKGSKHWTCKRCGEVLTEEIPVHTPTWSNWITDKKETCLEDGSKHLECTVCHKVLKTEKINKVDHKPVWEVVEPTCTEAGTSTKVCTVCKTVLETVTSPATGHKVYEWKVVKDPKACEDGEMAYVCKKCGYVKETKVLKSTTDHTFGKTATVIKAATCTEDGLKGIVCSVCGATKEGTTEVIPATGHTPGEWELVRKPSATQEGKKIQKCTVCGVQLGKKYIPATGSTSTKTSSKTIAFVKGEEVADYAKIDLSKDAITELDLVDAKGAKVGKLVVEVKEGTVTVKYELSAVPTEAFLTFVNEAPSKDITAEKAYEFEKAISVADELAGAAAAYIYVKIEF